MDQAELIAVAGYPVERELPPDLIGRAYLSRRAPGQAPVRILLISRKWGSGEAQAVRIRRLIQILSEVKSPGLLRSLTCETLPAGQAYLATEWASGHPFSTWLSTASEPQLLEALRQVAAMLASAHAVGVVHGLLNPSQLTISSTPYGTPQIHLRDLGLFAELCCPPSLLELDPAATEYLAPEQRRAGAQLAADSTADVYALGLLAHQSLARVRANSSAESPSAGTSEARVEEEFLSQLLREAPGERPAMAVVASVLQRWAGHAAAPAMKVTQPTPALPPSGQAAGQPETSAASGVQRAGTERLPHRQIGNFRFVRQLGAGGMGTVYEAVHEQIGRRVAIKIMNPKLARDPEFKERFLREACAANMVAHRSLVQITDFGSTEDGALYLVMEFLSGESLARRLEQNPKGLGPELALQISYDLARALAVLHAAQIIHRDLKPENIMMVAEASDAGEQREQVKILDFGIAKLMRRPDANGQDLTEAGRPMGSPEFMAPEQFVGAGAVDAKADVFSLALILCVMISGKRPFKGFSWILLHTDRPVSVEVPTILSPRLRQLVLRMLAVNPADRPSMLEVVQELKPRTLMRLPLLVGAAAVAMVCAATAHLLLKKPPGPPDPALLTHQAESILREGCRRTEAPLRTAAASAVGRAAQPDLGELLVPMLKDPDAKVRTAASLALATLAPPVSYAELLRIAESSPPGEAQLETAAALVRLGDSRGRGILRTLLPKLPGPMHYLAALRLCEAREPAGCAALSALLARRLEGIAELEALHALAVNGEKNAFSLLQERMRSAPDRLIQLGAASRIARLRGPQIDAGRARILLEQAAPRDFTAAVFAAQLQSEAGIDLLARSAVDPKNSLTTRVIAIQALGESGFIERGLSILGPLVLGTQQDKELQLSAAASVLLLVNPPRKEDLGALSALAGRSSLLAWLGDVPNPPSEESASDFSRFTSDERRLVVMELRRRVMARSLGVLLESLWDSDPAVRVEGGRALQQMIKTLRERGAPVNLDAVMQRLRRLTTSPRLTDQILAASIRAQLGEHEAAAWLQRLYTQSAEERVRALIVDLAQPAAAEGLLATALADPSALVRFKAARRLAEAGSAKGREVLITDGLAGGGARALIAYGLLLRLGVEVPDSAKALDWASILNKETDLWVRYEGIDALASLRPRDAVPLLRQALSDPAAVVRRRIAYVAYQLYGQEALPELREIVQHLVSDPELIVRMHAAKLLCDMGVRCEPDRDAAQKKSSKTPQTTTPDPLPVEIERPIELPSPLSLKQEEAVPVPVPAPAPLSVSPRVAERHPPVPKPPPIEQKPSAATVLEGKARQAEEKLNYVEALEHWNRILKLTEAQRTEAQQQLAQAAIKRLQPKVGRYRVHVLTNGACVPEGEIHFELPGNFVIKRGGKYKEVQLLAGHLSEVKLCR